MPVDPDGAGVVGVATDRTDGSNVDSISSLVRHQIDAPGGSTRKLAAASGDVVAHQTFSELAKGDIKAWPRPATVHAIAQALGTNARSVVLGYAVDLGIDVGEQHSTLAALLPAAARNLPPERARVIAQLVAWLTEHDEANVPAQPGEDEAPPTGVARSGGSPAEDLARSRASRTQEDHRRGESGSGPGSTAPSDRRAGP